MLGTQAAGRMPVLVESEVADCGRALCESLRSVVEERGGGATLRTISMRDVPKETWDSGAAIRLYCGDDDVRDFAVFGAVSPARDMVRWLFGYDSSTQISGARLRDGLGELLNQVVGRIKNELMGATQGAAIRLDTPQVLEKGGCEMYGRVHAEGAAFEVSSDAWSGTVVFMSSPRRHQAVAAIEQAESVLVRFGLEADAMARACRLLEDVRAPIVALQQRPALGITLSWCIESLAVLVDGGNGEREKALFHRVLLELESLRASLVRMTSPPEAAAFVVPAEEELRLLLGEFCEDVGRAVESAEETLSSGEGLAHRLFRTMRTIRGNAAFFGLEQVDRVAYATERFLGSLRDVGAELSLEQLDVVRESICLIEDWTEALHRALQVGGTVDWNEDLEDHARALERGLERGGGIESVSAYKASGAIGRGHQRALYLEGSQLECLDSIQAEAKRWADGGDTQDPDAQRAFLERVHSQLSAICESVRRVRLSQLLEGLARHTRELAQRHGKLVRVDVSGEALTAPEHLVAALSGALVHLVNNAVEHGVEAPTERLAGGKNVLASVELRAARGGEGEFVFEVVDDGRGIQRRKVLAMAVGAGVAEDGAEVSDALELVFHPEVSTGDAEGVLDRGMGLDAVRRELAQLGGRVETVSTPGMGTRVRLVVPDRVAALHVAAEPVEDITATQPEIEAGGELNFL